MAKRDCYDVLGVPRSASKDDIKKKTQSLIQASMKLGEAVYKSQQKPGTKTQDKENNKTNDKDNVVDADFEDVKDKEEDKEKSA